MFRIVLLGCASLIVIAAIGASQASPARPSAPTAPAAPKAPSASSTPTAPAAPAAPAGPVQRYDVKGIEVSDVFGTLHVTISDRGPVTLAMSGPKAVLDGVQVSADGGLLRISESHPGHVWDWHEWFDFKRTEKRERVTLDITAPKGSSLDVDGFVGELNVGDIEGPVKIGAAAAEGSIGKVTSADIGLAGSGKLTVGTVAQQLRISIAGSGTVNAGASAGATIDIGGSGDSSIGPVLGTLRVDIAGSGDVAVVSVNGPTHVDTAGSGSVKIETGEANPLKVDMLGAGDFAFGGEAVNPSISALGSGNVAIKSYRGRLDTDGMAHVKIGQ